MAQARVVVVARQPFTYRDQAVTPGDVCLVRPIEAASLVYQKNARWPDADEALGVYAHRSLTAEYADPPTPSRRRTYRRRDLTADAS